MGYIAPDLSGVLAPVAEAKGLPNEFYTDPQTFDAEKRHVFFANWSAIGFAKDVPEPGDAMPIDFLGMPLLAVRDLSGTVNVFQNTCRHRGMVMVTEKTKIKGAIRCPYHSWCYDLEGALKTTPHVGGPGHNTHDDIKRDELGLLRIRSHVWRDVIFVNVDDSAAPFEEANAEVIARWAEFEKPMYHGGTDSTFKLELETNWKLAVENYCESYHLPWVHPALNTYSRLEDHYHIESEAGFSGQGTYVYRQLKDETGRSFGDFEDLSTQWDEGAEYIALYPNLLLGVHRDHAFALMIEPLACGRSREHIELYYAQEADTGEASAQLRATNTAQWKTVFEEDIFVVEGMQKGRHGLKFDGGKFSPAMDGPTHTFHRWVAQQFQDK